MQQAPGGGDPCAALPSACQARLSIFERTKQEVFWSLHLRTPSLGECCTELYLWTFWSLLKVKPLNPPMQSWGSRGCPHPFPCPLKGHGGPLHEWGGHNPLLQFQYHCSIVFFCRHSSGLRWIVVLSDLLYLIYLLPHTLLCNLFYSPFIQNCWAFIYYCSYKDNPIVPPFHVFIWCKSC